MNKEFNLTLCKVQFELNAPKGQYNKFGGFKLKYNGLEIDLWLSDDLFSAIQYNVDGLFYDLSNRALVSLSAPVVHITNDELSRNWDLRKESRLISSKVQIISEDDIPVIQSSSIYKLPKGQLYCGDILIKDPFEQNCYMKLDENIAQKIRYKKYCKIREIAQKLGASGCDIKECSKHESGQQGSEPGEFGCRGCSSIR